MIVVAETTKKNTRMISNKNPEIEYTRCRNSSVRGSSTERLFPAPVKLLLHFQFQLRVRVPATRTTLGGVRTKASRQNSNCDGRK